MKAKFQLISLTLAGTIWGMGSPSYAFTATNFQEASSTAPIVVLAKYNRGKENAFKLKVLQVIAGKVATDLAMSRNTLFEVNLTTGSTYLFLLESETEAYRSGNMCGTYNALEIVDGLVMNPEKFGPRFGASKYKKPAILTLAQVVDWIQNARKRK